MRWRGRRQSSNVDDRRSQGGQGGFRRGGRIRMPGMPRSRTARRAGGGGIGMIIVILVVAWFLGINPMTLLQGTGNLPSTPSAVPQQQTTQSPAGSGVTDEMKQFVSVVLAETEDVWHRIFKENGAQYREPQLVLFTGQVQSACGFASSASGPFYCPGDSKVYIDLSFYEELKRKFEAPGDFAQAYVIAHEIGHHVQNLIGVLPEFNRRRSSMSKTEQNQMSTRVELQADCFAGVWGFYAQKQGLLEAGDLEEALNAATQIGDDAIQKRTIGYVVPESFNHGTSEQRRRWFRRGFDSGSWQTCDTFSTNDL